MNSFSERLKSIRTDKGLSQHDLATRVGVMSATISRYESGSRNSQWEILSKLARELDTSTDYLLGLSDNPYPIDTVIQTSKLTYDQLDLLDKYINISESEQVLVRERARAFYDATNNATNNEE